MRDDLNAKARAAGRPPDSDMAMEMLRAFGRPAQTAVRYHRPFTIIDPSDTWNFVIAAVAGGFVLSILLTFVIATQIGWHSRYGTIFADPQTDERLIPGIAIASGVLMLVGGLQLYRQYNRVRPAPAAGMSPAT